jgi:hypothetical protein
MSEDIKLDRYDRAVLRCVSKQHDLQAPAIADIFKGLQDDTKCYSTLRYRLRSLMNAGFLKLDKQRDRVLVILTQKGHVAAQSAED